MYFQITYGYHAAAHCKTDLVWIDGPRVPVMMGIKTLYIAVIQVKLKHILFDKKSESVWAAGIKLSDFKTCRCGAARCYHIFNCKSITVIQ